MITFKQFLAEEDQSKDLVDFINSNCRPFLKATGLTAKQALNTNSSLWRGLQPSTISKAEVVVLGEAQEALICKTRKDREPLDTHPDINAAVNAWFKKKYGYSARAEGVFCYGAASKHIADNFGEAYQIMPIGPLHVLWSPKVSDLTGILASEMHRSDIGLRDIKSRYEGPDLAKLKKIIGAALDNLHFQDHDLIEAIHGKSPKEILIKCDSYLAFK